MNLIVIGINHRTAPLEIREQLWLSVDEKRQILRTSRERFFSECFVVSTCNRTELYGITDDTHAIVPGSDGLRNLQQFFLHAKSGSTRPSPDHVYVLSAVSAVKHLFRVAAGVDSMIVGDIQILGQIKDDFQLAIEEHAAGTMLHKLLQTALHLGKRVRTETTLTEGAVSISYAAVELANKIFADLSDRKALLIGAGETGELTAKHLSGRGIGELIVTNRTRSKADELASTFGGTAVNFDEVLPVLSAVDIIISSVTSEGFVLTAGQIKQAVRRRRHSPLFIIDIGVPRNIDPAANDLDNVFVNDMDSLSEIVTQNINKRRAELPAVNAFIIEEMKNIHSWYKSLQVGPTIHDLRNHFEEIRREEVSQHINRFSQQDRDLVDLVTKRILNKLLHHPTVTLRNGHDETETRKTARIDLVRNLFGLDEYDQRERTKEKK